MEISYAERHLLREIDLYEKSYNKKKANEAKRRNFLKNLLYPLNFIFKFLKNFVKQKKHHTQTSNKT